MIVIGETYGVMVPLEQIGEKFHGRGRNRCAVFRAECSVCGHVAERTAVGLRSSRRVGAKHCKECVKGTRNHHGRKLPAKEGERCGRWTVLADLGGGQTRRDTDTDAIARQRIRSCGRRIAWARCDCGEIELLDLSNARHGHSTQCTRCGRKRGEVKERKCQWCLRTRADGTHFPPDCPSTCQACLRRAPRNGRCGQCRFPLYKTKPHTCGEAVRVVTGKRTRGQPLGRNRKCRSCDKRVRSAKPDCHPCRDRARNYAGRCSRCDRVHRASHGVLICPKTDCRWK